MSWENVAKSYDKIVGKEGHYYHQSVICPKLSKLFNFDSYSNPKLLDLGCGSGVLREYISNKVTYVGVDASSTLIKLAEKKRRGTFKVADLTIPLHLHENDFTHVVFLLSLQNMGLLDVALENGTRHLAPNGKIYLILNHPYFRIPRQTSWEVDQEKKIQYRRIDRYLTPMSIPINMNPSQKEEGQMTHSHHVPLSTYINTLGKLGLGVSHMEEWISDKESTGKAAKMENRAREEIPLFMLIVAEKVTK